MCPTEDRAVKRSLRALAAGGCLLVLLLSPAPVLADVLVNWSGLANAGGSATGESGSLSTLGSSADVSATSCSTCVSSYGDARVGIPAADTVSLSAIGSGDHATGEGTMTADVVASFEVVSPRVPAGVPMPIVISLTLSGELDVSAAASRAGSSVSLTSSLGSAFEQSLTASNYTSNSQQFSVTQSEMIRVPVGQSFSFDPSVILDAFGGGGGMDGSGNGSASAILSFSARPEDPKVFALSDPPPGPWLFALADPTPEPPSALLMICGFAALVLAVCRRRYAQA